MQLRYLVAEIGDEGVAALCAAHLLLVQRHQQLVLPPHLRAQPLDLRVLGRTRLAQSRAALLELLPQPVALGLRGARRRVEACRQLVSRAHRLGARRVVPAGIVFHLRQPLLARRVPRRQLVARLQRLRAACVVMARVVLGLREPRPRLRQLRLRRHRRHVYLVALLLRLGGARLRSHRALLGRPQLGLEVGDRRLGRARPRGMRHQVALQRRILRARANQLRVCLREPLLVLGRARRRLGGCPRTPRLKLDDEARHLLLVHRGRGPVLQRLHRLLRRAARPHHVSRLPSALGDHEGGGGEGGGGEGEGGGGMIRNRRGVLDSSRIL